jgi:hypothetical protein
VQHADRDCLPTEDFANQTNTIGIHEKATVSWAISSHIVDKEYSSQPMVFKCRFHLELFSHSTLTDVQESLGAASISGFMVKVQEHVRAQDAQFVLLVLT